MCVALLSVPAASIAFPCGGGACESDESCCSGMCCPSGLNIYCSGSNTCYDSTSDAEADCGSNYAICSSSADDDEEDEVMPMLEKIKARNIFMVLRENAQGTEKKNRKVEDYGFVCDIPLRDSFYERGKIVYRNLRNM